MTQQNTKSAGKIWSKEFTTLFIVSFVMSMGQYMLNTLIPIYAKELGAEATIVGVVAGAFAVTALSIRPIAGPAMDYFKKNRLMTMSIALILMAYVTYSLSHSVGMLIVGRLIHGIGMGTAAPLSLALVSNTLPSEKMASGLGVFSLGSAISTAVGPTIGLELSEVIGYNATFFICTGLLVVCFGLSLLLRSDVPVRPERFRISLRQIIAPEVLMTTLVIMLQFIAVSSTNAFIAIYGKEQNIGNFGLYFTAGAVCMILIRPFSGRFADRYGVDKSVVPGLIIYAAALIFISFCRTLPMFIIGGVVAAFGFGISEPILQTMNMQLAPKERRGAAGNTNFIGIDVGMLLGPILTGKLVTEVQLGTGDKLLGYEVMFRVIVIPVIAAAVVFALNRKKLRAGIKAQKEASMLSGSL